MKKITALSLSLAAAIFLAGCGSQPAAQTNNNANNQAAPAKTETPAKPELSQDEKDLIAVAEEINKTLPTAIDKDTRLDKVLAPGKNTLEYDYTLINVAKADLDLAVLEKEAAPGILNNVKTNPDMQPFRDKKTTLVYSYKDKNGAYLFKVEASPEKYLAK